MGPALWEGMIDAAPSPVVLLAVIVPPHMQAYAGPFIGAAHAVEPLERGEDLVEILSGTA